MYIIIRPLVLNGYGTIWHWFLWVHSFLSTNDDNRTLNISLFGTTVPLRFVGFLKFSWRSVECKDNIIYTYLEVNMLLLSNVKQFEYVPFYQSVYRRGLHWCSIGLRLTNQTCRELCDGHFPFGFALLMSGGTWFKSFSEKIKLLKYHFSTFLSGRLSEPTTFQLSSLRGV